MGGWVCHPPRFSPQPAGETYIQPPGLPSMLKSALLSSHFVAIGETYIQPPGLPSMLKSALLSSHFVAIQALAVGRETYIQTRPRNGDPSYPRLLEAFVPQRPPRRRLIDKLARETAIRHTPDYYMGLSHSNLPRRRPIYKLARETAIRHTHDYYMGLSHNDPRGGTTSGRLLVFFWTTLLRGPPRAGPRARSSL